jgi:polysaccharide export outer membrane protein
VTIEEHIRHPAKFCAIVLSGTLMVSCASAPTPAPPPTPAEAQTRESDHIIRPGDPLEVFVFRHPELSLNVPVGPDGRISTPYVEDMVAAGKTPPQLARDIEKVLSQSLRAPKVSIILTQPLDAVGWVKVEGEVAHPSSLPCRDGTHVLDAILAAGGLTQFASGNEMRILRVENGKETIIHVGKQNMLLQSGDVLVVPQSNR